MPDTKARIKQILNDCCAGNASLATDILYGEFIIIPRDELPETFNSTNGNGICSHGAQEFYQPELYFHPADGDEPGTWNRKIAYANLAVALAVEEKINAQDAERSRRRDELAVEYFEGVYEYLPRGGYRKAIDRIIELEGTA